jgi:secreted trypsin-like serine protease
MRNKINWPKSFLLKLIHQIGPRPFCGGSIISPNYILTAAHCAEAVGNNANSVGVVLGDINYQVSWGQCFDDYFSGFTNFRPKNRLFYDNQ